MTHLQPISITSLSPEDLASLGYDLTNVTQDDLKAIRRRMSDVYVEDRFWDDLEIIADNLKIPKVAPELRMCDNCGCTNRLHVWANGSRETPCDNCGYSETP